MNIKKYISIYLMYLKNSLIREMNYRLNFLLMSLTTIFLNLYFIIFYLVLAELSNNNFLGWNRDQLLFFLGTEIICHSLFMSFCFYNVFSLPEKINSGDFDYILLQPINPRFNLSTFHIDIPMFTQTVLGIGLCVYSFNKIGLEISALKIILYVLLVINSIFMMYLIAFGLMSLSFFFGKIFTSGSSFPYRGFFSLYWFARRPQSIYSSALVKVLTYFIPVLLIINLPVNIILEEVDYYLVFHAFITNIILFKITTIVWKRGLKKYESASS